MTTEQLRDEWLARLHQLLELVESCARESDWSTRRIEKRLKDRQIGTYVAPALMMQHETTRLLLEPIARSAPGAEGIVDLCLMPAYDDMAHLYFENGQWRLQRAFPGSLGDFDSEPVNRESLLRVMNEMREHAASLP